MTGAGVFGAFAPELPPGAPYEVPLSITSGGSGFSVSISCSTGMLAGAGAIVFAAVFASGVFIGMLLFGGRNFVGYFSCGNAEPAGIGTTISGVTITINSVLVRVFCMD